MAKEVLSVVLSEIGPETRNMFNIKFNPGGESVIKKEFIPMFCRENNSSNYIFFDGDQKPDNSHYDWTNFAVSDLTVDFLKSKIREQTSEEIKFSVDSLGNIGNEQQQIDLLKKYLEYYNRNVFYLPKNTPEEIIWNDEFSTMMAQSVLDNLKFIQYSQECNAANSFKEKFSVYTKYIIGNNTSEDILNTQKIFVQKWGNAKNQDYQNILEAINSIINNG